MAELWEKRDGETNKAYEAFKIYLDMGYKRSLSKTAILLGHKNQQTVNTWSRKNEWQRRIEAYDKQQAKEALYQSRHKAAELSKNTLALFEAPAIALAKKLKQNKVDLEDMDYKFLFGLLFQSAKYMGALAELQETALSNIIEDDLTEKDETNNQLTDLLNNEGIGDKLNDILSLMESTKDDVAGNNG
jgi:hypothetical protein